LSLINDRIFPAGSWNTFKRKFQLLHFNHYSLIMKISMWIPALLILLFMYTGFSKFFAMGAFTGTMLNQPIPHRLAAALAIVLPCIEVATAVCLLFNRTRVAGLYASLVLLTVFTGYIAAILLHFFRKVPCSCGGIFHKLTWMQHFWLNLLLLTLTAIATLSALRQRVSPPLNLIK
jgi:putative oxidoreductase